MVQRINWYILMSTKKYTFTYVQVTVQNLGNVLISTIYNGYMENLKLNVEDAIIYSK
jgi:hypothetical protein